jgi:hypothetical protein
MNENERETPIMKAVIAMAIPDDPIGNVMRIIEKANQLERMCTELAEASWYVANHWPNMVTANALAKYTAMKEGK